METGVLIELRVASWSATVELARELAPDVVVMDVGMPDLNGIDATQQITRVNPKIKVLALSMHSGKKFVMAMLKAGASGYLLKDCALEELTGALRTIVNGKTYLSPSITDVVIQNYVHPTPGDDQSAFSPASVDGRVPVRKEICI